MYKVLACMLLMSGAIVRAQSRGYQYSSFSGPVSGAIREISVPYVPVYSPHQPLPRYSSPGETAVDYVAKPDYSFTYGVEDPETGNSQKHTESRDGDSVKGQYSVVEPDGTLRIVSYTADPTDGFRASVRFTGTPTPAPPPTKYREYDEYE